MLNKVNLLPNSELAAYNTPSYNSIKEDSSASIFPMLAITIKTMGNKEEEKGFFGKIADFFKGMFKKDDKKEASTKETKSETQEAPKAEVTITPIDTPKNIKEENLSDTGFKLEDSNVINGEIDEVFKQGQQGDCVFLSTLLSFSQTPEGREIIKNAISVNKDENGEIESYDVTFQGINKTYSFAKQEVLDSESNNEEAYLSDEMLRKMGLSEEEIAQFPEEMRYGRIIYGNTSEYSSGDSDVLLLEMALEKCLNDSENTVLQEYMKYESKEDNMYGIPCEIVGLLFTGNSVSVNNDYYAYSNDVLTKNYMKYVNEYMSPFEDTTTDIEGNKIDIEAGITYEVKDYDKNGNGQVTLIHPTTKESFTVDIEQFAKDLDSCARGMGVESATKEEILANINNKTAVIYGFKQQDDDIIKVQDINGKTQEVVSFHAYCVNDADDKTITLINPHDSSKKIVLSWDEFEKISDGEFWSYNLA